MKDTLTVAERLKEAGFADNQASALTRAIEGFAEAKDKEVEDRMNRDLAAAIERSNAKFEQTMREQTRWIAAIVFSALGILIALSGTILGIILHYK